MKIDHNDAISIEWIVRDAIHCNPLDFGGIVSAGTFEKHPEYAAILCIAKLRREENETAISEFYSKWSTIFEYPDENSEHTLLNYKTELQQLVKIMTGRASA